MCNPPGGDWSGLSIIENNYENRWLSLPRVSDAGRAKRPDHLLEIFGVFRPPLLLSIESKEQSSDLETDVGTRLVTYVRELMSFVPSVKRRIRPNVEEWQWGDNIVDFDRFETMSAAAYLRGRTEVAFNRNCEILFVMNPLTDSNNLKWNIDIIPSTQRSQTLKEFILQQYMASGDRQFLLR